MLTKEISEVEKEIEDKYGDGWTNGNREILEAKLSTLKSAQQKFDKLITQTAKKFNSEHLLKDETYELGYLLKLSQQKAVEE
jgi:hypothetical protein